MKQREFISRFSPNQTSPEILEKMLVQRSSIIDEAVALCRESIDTSEKHHLLFVGPRGIGKTHLLTLIHHRLEHTKTRRKYWVAWLNEDKTKASFLQLIRQIHEALSARYPDAFPMEDIAELKKLPLESIEYEWKKLLLRRMKKHAVLVLMENLDAAFKDMKPAEQKKWRSFIQDSRLFSTVATAQSLTDYFTNYGEPFYGFFKTWHLKPLTADETSELLKNIARLQGNTDMVNYLESSDGRARIYALHCLSGGNPRLYVVLSGILARQGYGSHGSVEEFEEMVDQQLTPYYQERLRWISSQQREIVEYLCSQTTPVPVKTISQETFIPHSTLTSQLKSLKELGYVVSTPHGRESFYELSEPLMRIAMQVKDVRGMQPLKTIVDFLQIWYRQEELEKMVAEEFSELDQNPRRVIYAKAACRKMRSSKESLCAQLLRGSIQNIDEEKCSEEEFKRLQTIAHWEGNTDSQAILKYARACVKRGEYRESLKYVKRLIENNNVETIDLILKLCDMSLCLVDMQLLQEAIEIYTIIIKMTGVRTSIVVRALNSRGNIYSILRKKEKALEDYTRAIELDSTESFMVAWALSSRGNIYSDLGEKEKALEDYTRAIELEGGEASTKAWALLKRGDSYSDLGEEEKAVEDYTRAIEMEEASTMIVSWALSSRGDIYSDLGEEEKAVEDYTRAIEFDGLEVSTVVRVLINRGDVYSDLGEEEKAVEDYTRAIELEGGEASTKAWALVNRGCGYLDLGEKEKALEDYTRTIEMEEATTMAVSWALINRGDVYSDLGEKKKALEDYTRVIKLEGKEAFMGLCALRKITLLDTVLNTEKDEEVRQWIAELENKKDNSETALACLRGAFAVREKGPWKKRMDDLTEVLKRGKVAEVSAYGLLAQAVIDEVMKDVSSKWAAKAKKVVEVFAPHEGGLIVLGNSLVRKLKGLKGYGFNESVLDSWGSAWIRAAENHEEMALPLRLLSAGIEWIKLGSDKALLSLNLQERPLVYTALGLEKEDKDEN